MLKAIGQAAINAAWGLAHPRKAEQVTSEPVAPKRSPRRAPGRRGFTAAKNNRLLNDWPRHNESSSQELRVDLPVLRARSRHVTNNQDYGKRYLQLVETNLIGDTGPKLRSKALREDGTPDRSARKKIQDAWLDFCESGQCSIAGHESFADVARIIGTSVARDGEILISHVRGRQAGNRWNYAVQLIEPDHLDHTHETLLPNGNQVVMGVELTPAGRPVRYSVLEVHPGELGALLTGGKRRFVDAGDLVHAFVRERPGDVRGKPWTRTAMMRLHMGGGYEWAELVAAREGANKMGFFTTPDGEAVNVDDEEEDGQLITESEAGVIETLPEGVSFEPYDPQHPTGAFGDFTKNIYRGAAMGFGVSYMSLTGDLQGASFSSARVGLLDERDGWRVKQQWLASCVLRPIFLAWLEMAITSGEVRLPMSGFDRFARHAFRGRGWRWVDPDKDSKSAERDIGTGLRSRTEILDEQGRDFEDVIEQLAEEERLASDKGVDINKVTSNANPEPDEAEEPNNDDVANPQGSDA